MKYLQSLSALTLLGKSRGKQSRLSEKWSAVLLLASFVINTCPAPGQPSPPSGKPSSLSYTAGDPVPAAGSPSPVPGESGDPPPPPAIADNSSAPVPVAQTTQKTGYAPAAVSPSLPVAVGTVEVRKPFKIFVREELIRNLSFRDTPVREVIGELARRGGINIFIDKSVSGTITGDLKDVTLNEAMDIVLASASIESRVLDNNMVVVGTRQSMVQLGLNRTSARAFKLSYSHPYDIANILYASVFNRGMLPEINSSANYRSTDNDRSERREESQEIGSNTSSAPSGGAQQSASRTQTSDQSGQDSSSSAETRDSTRLDTPRSLRGLSREQVQEGVGYNNAATDPGSQQIRTFRSITADYAVEQNGGGAIILPDVQNRQVIVIGTPDDLNLAEEAIRLIDRRPRQIHVQASLIELDNQAIRQIGANLALQGAGASTSILGNASAPLISLLPGLGGNPPTVASSFANTITINQSAPTAPSNIFSAASAIVNSVARGSLVSPANPFGGILGSFLPPTPTGIANVTPSATGETGFNFLTLSKRAGGNANIATFPAGLNVSLNLLLETEKTKILANPSVIVNDNTEALITIANEVLHKVTSTVSLGVVSTNIELTKAGIFLNVLPRVTEDGFIVMRMRPQVSQPFGPPIILANNTVEVQLLSIREVMAQEVRIKDGQTLVVGGLFTENEAANISKVPYLAEAPILGALFRNTLKGRSRTELLLLLTPKIVEEEATGPGPVGGPTL